MCDTCSQLILLSSSLLAICNGLDGSLLLLTESNEKLVTESFSIPPQTNSAPVQYEQALTEDLAGFSLTCDSCIGTTKLIFLGDPVQVCVVLSDHTLSVLHLEEKAGQAKATQVLALDDQCTPQYLKTISFSTSDFAVVCADMSLHFATLHSNQSVSLGEFSNQCGKDNVNGIFLESARDSQLKAVSYNGEHTLDVCSLSGGTIENPELPQNVNCLNNTMVYPLPTTDTFILHCTTQGGPTLYIVRVPQNTEAIEDARSIQVDGRPYSSPNGTYIAVVDGRQVTAYITANAGVPGNAKGFLGQISIFEFLNDHTVLIVTDKEHIVMDLANSSLQPRSFTNGLPIAWVWVNSSNDYIYAVKNDELQLYTIYVVNETSTNPTIELKDVTNQPSMLLFIENSKSSTKSSGLSTSEGTNVPAIIGGTVTAAVVVIVAVFTVAGLVVSRKRCRLVLPPYTRELELEPTHQPTNSTPESTKSTPEPTNSTPETSDSTLGSTNSNLKPTNPIKESAESNRTLHIQQPRNSRTTYSHFVPGPGGGGNTKGQKPETEHASDKTIDPKRDFPRINSIPPSVSSEAERNRHRGKSDDIDNSSSPLAHDPGITTIALPDTTPSEPTTPPLAPLTATVSPIPATSPPGLTATTPGPITPRTITPVPKKTMPDFPGNESYERKTDTASSIYTDPVEQHY